MCLNLRMGNLIRILFWASVVALPVACWQKDAFVDGLVVDGALADEPRQGSTEARAFEVVQNDVAYRIEPLHSYELYGLVVSMRLHDGDHMLHRVWNDHLNVADVCVVWGSNARDLDLNAFDFYNGQFTCFFETRDADAWRRFDRTAISNNHLISDDAYLRTVIEDLEVGDQIRLEGWLARYSHDGFERGTSTTRTDTGNGACETIYVRSLELLSRMQSFWRTLLDVASVGVFSSACLWVVGIGRGWI